MENNSAVQWLKQSGSLDAARKLVPQIKKIFTPCLGIQNDKLLIIGDTGIADRKIAAILTAAYYLSAQELNLDAKLILQEPKSRGDEAEEQVIRSLTSLTPKSAIILNMSDKLGGIGDLGKSFRKWIKKKDHRFVSAMSLGDLSVHQMHHIVNAMDVSYPAFGQTHALLKKKMDATKEIRIRTKLGSDLVFNKEGIESMAADGNYTKPGSGGNLPAGEVYCPPNGKNVHGKIVIDGSSRIRDGTILVKNPITLLIEEGNIVDIQGKEEAQKLRETLDWAATQAKNPGSVRRVCEFGIGLNPQAKVIGATIVDEKALGTAHIGLGSNYWFGGNIFAIVHLDQVFFDPVIEFDGKELQLE